MEEYLDAFIDGLENDIEVDMDESKPIVTEEEEKLGQHAIHKV